MRDDQTAHKIRTTFKSWTKAAAVSAVGVLISNPALASGGGSGATPGGADSATGAGGGGITGAAFGGTGGGAGATGGAGGVGIGFVNNAGGAGGAVAGQAGGNGGSGLGDGGGGGGGGAHGYVGAALPGGPSAGGNGGAGGFGAVGGGGGGGGGWGAVVTGTGSLGALSSSVTGGNGGVGGDGTPGGDGGTGGIGLVFTGAGAKSATLQAAIAGGNGGVAGLSVFGPLGVDGAGGAGIVASDLSLTIDTGGSVTRGGTAFAMDFTGGSNSLTITSGAGAGVITGGINAAGALNFAQTANYNLSNVISGAGAISKTGTGTLTLSGANTYTGATTISAGTISIASAAALGSTPSITLNGGSLQTGGTFTISTPVASSSGLASNGLASTSGTVTYSGALTGSAALNLSGAGAMAFTNSNTSLSSPLAVSVAQLNVGANTALGTGQITWSGNRSLSVTAANVTLPNAIDLGTGLLAISPGPAHTLTLPGVISGSGSILVSSGTLALNGSNTFTGGGTVDENATVVLGASNALGSGAIHFRQNAIIRAGATSVTLPNAILLELGEAGGVEPTVDTPAGDTLTLSGVISGSGRSLIKTGDGTLILNGNNTFTGQTIVNQGTIRVNGTLVNPVTFASGTFLGGNGTIVGNQNIGAGVTISPGNSIGTLTINGNLTLNDGSTTQIEVFGSTIDRINVTGTASLAGTLQLIPTGGAYAFNTPYTFVSSTGALTGTFSPVTTTGVFGVGVTPAISYTANSAQLTLRPGTLGVISPSNPFAVAQAIDRAVAGGADASPYFNVYNQASRDALVSAVNSLGGEIHTASSAIGLDASDQFLRVMLEPAEQSRETGENYAAWAAGFGDNSRTDADAATGAARRKSSSENFALGLDYTLSPKINVGAAVSAGKGTSKLAGNLGESEGDIFQAGLYGGWGLDVVKLKASMAYTSVDAETNRAMSALPASAKASYEVQAWGARLEALAPLNTVGDARLSTFGALQYQDVELPGIRETNAANGAAFGVSANSQNNVTARSEIGLKLETKNDPVRQLKLHASLAWAHYLEREADFAANIIGLSNSGFIIEGARPSDDSALFALGGDFALTDKVSVGARLRDEFGDRQQNYQANLSMQMRF